MSDTGTRTTLNEHGTPSTAVIYAIAEREGVDPTDLDRPLYEVLDPEAMDALFSESDSSVGQLQFRYLGYEVRLTSNGSVQVSEPDGQ